MDKNQLTAAEMGKLWATYIGNTMGECVTGYYLKHVDDVEIKKVLEHAQDLCQTYIHEIKKIFTETNFPIPEGFSVEDDVNIDAPRLYLDEFYLHYLQYLGKAGMSIYSVAIPLVTRKDVRKFFVNALEGAVQLMCEVNDLLKSKGKFMNPPQMPSPEGIDYVTKQSFLNDFLGDDTPLHGLEVAHLFGNINNDIASKALMLGFVQGAKREEVKKFLERGIEINQKHIEKFSSKLNQSNVPSPSLLDHLVTTSTTPAFSDKLMVYHKIDMFSMKIREYANGASLDGRKDIGALYAKCQLDVALYVEDGANLLIDHGWMEQPPLVIDREELSK